MKCNNCQSEIWDVFEDGKGKISVFCGKCGDIATGENCLSECCMRYNEPKHFICLEPRQRLVIKKSGNEFSYFPLEQTKNIKEE